MTRELLINHEGGEHGHKLATDAEWHDTGGRLILMATTQCCRPGCKSAAGVYKPGPNGEPMPLPPRERIREIADNNGWALLPGGKWLCPECVDEWGYTDMTVARFVLTPKVYPDGHPLGPPHATSEAEKPQEARK